LGGATCARVDVPVAPAPTDDGGLGAGDAMTEVPVEAPVADAAEPGDAPATADASLSMDAPASSDTTVADADGGAGAEGGASSDGRASDGASPAGDGGRPPPMPLCLATCVADGDCVAGLVCRTLPGGANGAWANVCVPPFYRPVADSCRDAEGQLDDHVCSTGLCADLGAIGLCSASCAAGATCPTGTACATFGDGRSLCLLTCSTSSSCASDPLLDCETGAGGGDLGFQVFPPAPTATFCAPRACTSAADCGPAGTCKPLGVGAHCVPN
jgi:hypothetical protein